MRIRPLLPFCLLLSFSSAFSTPKSSCLSLLSENNLAKESDAAIYSKNADANALYIKGLEYLSKGDARVGGSMLNAKKALELFVQAVQKDPQFALAYLGQAEALGLSSFTVPGSSPPGKTYRQQEAAALKAVELDDKLSQAHVILAEIYFDNEYDWPKAEKELKRVIELDPNRVLAHTRYGIFLGAMGRFDEAIAEVKLAQKIDESSGAPNRAMMQVLYWQHEDNAALAQGLEALRKDKVVLTHFSVGLIYIHQGQYEKAVEEMKLVTVLGDAGSLAALAYAYAMAGNKIELDNVLDRFRRHPAHDHVPYYLAAVYVALGDKDRAIRLIEKDYRSRGYALNRLKVDPVMDPLRQEPRFKKLMRKMNFEQ
jgi:tetratricopeptide (TPR) repeat protein